MSNLSKMTKGLYAIATAMCLTMVLFMTSCGDDHECPKPEKHECPTPEPKASELKVFDHKVIHGKKLVYSFDKELKKELAEKTTAYKVTKKDGKEVPVSKVELNVYKPHYPEVKVTDVTLILGESLKTGDYTVSFNGLEATDGTKLKEDATKQVFNYKSVWKKVENLKVETFTYEKVNRKYVPKSPYDQDVMPVIYSLTNNKEIKHNTRKEVYEAIDWDIMFSFQSKKTERGDIKLKLIIGGDESIEPKNRSILGCGLQYSKEGFKPVKNVDDIKEIRIAKSNPFTRTMNLEAEEGEVFGCIDTAGGLSQGQLQSFKKDDLGWYEENEWEESDNKPIQPATILVFKTRDGKYGKLEILSLYKGEAPTSVNWDFKDYYLTFRYVFQEDGSTNVDIPVDID